MKIYTKTGDGGDTGLFVGPRVSKDDSRIEAFGTVDELNAFLGAARAEGLPQEVDCVVERIQHGLFSLGAELATPNPSEAGLALVDDAQIAWLEKTIAEHEQHLSLLRQFIVPGGTKGASALHVARGVCRRAERRVVTLQRAGTNVSRCLCYLNRVGDLMFVLARRTNAIESREDIPWDKSASEESSS